MSLHYLDTSALVKRYVNEVGSEQIDALMSVEPLAVSALVRVEVASVLARRMREGTLTQEQRDRLYR